MASGSRESRQAEIRSRKIILSGFAVVLVVILAVVTFALNRLRNVHDTFVEVVSREQAAIESLYHMQEAARNRAVLLYKITSVNDPFERDELAQQHGNLGGRFAAARQKLSQLGLEQKEQALLDQVNGHVNVAQSLQVRVLDEIAAGHLKPAVDLMNRQAIPAQQALLDSIRSFLEFELSRSNTHADLLLRQQNQTRLFLIIGGALAASVAVMIALFIHRRMNTLISGLTRVTSRLEDASHSLDSLNLAVDQHCIVSIADARGVITYANDKFCQISGYSREELIGKTHRLINSGHHPKLFFRSMWATISSGNVWQGEVCNRSKGGEEYWVYSTIVPFLNNLDMPVQYISVRTDITTIKHAEQVLLRSKEELEELVQERTQALVERDEILQSISNAAQDAMIMVDAQGCVTHWNPAAVRMFGFARQEAAGCDLQELIIPERLRGVQQDGFAGFASSGEGGVRDAVLEIEARRKDGSEFPLEISIAAVPVRGEWHAVAIMRDITSRKQAEEKLKQLAITDTLTGAYNRRKFNEVLEAELARAARYKSQFSLMIFDIDHFKRINDGFGHQAGDQVLLKVALLVNQNIRQTDIFARWGGEEFVILAPLCDTVCPAAFADKLRKLVDQYSFDEVGHVTCSFGVTNYLPGDTKESLLKRADEHLYLAKNSGRNRVIFDDKAA